MLSLEDELRAGLSALDLQLAGAQVQQLLQFAGLLQKWTRVYNLTALRRPEEVLTHHILDSAAVLGPLRQMRPGGVTRLLDVGSGGGLPGAVIAIARPDMVVDCVDTVAKKTAFIQQSSAALGLRNLRAIHARVEQLDEQNYDVVGSRAFATLADFVNLSGGALASDGLWMAMKGRYPEDEVAALPPEVELFHVEQLRVPGLSAERCLVWLRRRSA
jgi:16S rRNA (guanine527-N7)-methyltransferase